MMDIGYFYSDKDRLMEAFESHAAIILRCADEYSESSVNARMMQIKDRGVRHSYYHVDEDGRFKQKIMGIQFQAIFTNTILNPAHERYILSRFRPRLK